MDDEYLSVSGVAVKRAENFTKPEYDPMTAALFLRWWFGDTPQGILEIGCDHHDGNGIRQPSHYDLSEWTLEHVAQTYGPVNGRGASIYFRPALLVPHDGSANDSHFAAAAGIWADLDTPEAIETAAKVETLIRPSGVVITGTVPTPRMQLWYKAAELITDGATVRSLNKRLATLYGGKADPAVVNPTSYMRLPGFVSWPKKNKPGRIPELVTFQPMEPARRYTVARFQDALPQIEQTEPKASDQGQRATDILELCSALAAIPNTSDSWEEWNRIAMAVWAATGGSELGFAAFSEWCRKWPGGYDPDATRKRWDAIAGSPPTDIGAGTIFKLARDAGWSRPRPDAQTEFESEPADPQDEFASEPAPEADSTAAPDGVLFPEEKADTRYTPDVVSHDGLALLFTDLPGHKQRLRYVGAWGKWFIYDRGRWAEDDKGRISELARLAVREVVRRFHNAGQPVPAGWSTSHRMASLLEVASSDPAHAATVDQWDTDPWLLNTPSGVVDLHTGEMRPHRAADYMTKMTAVPPGGECPRFLQFLDEIFDGNADLIAYMQRLLGYVLTGDMSEHAFFFWLGSGRNGKSVLNDIVAYILADYAVIAAPETFIQAEGDRHPTELARLRGARLVTATETEKGRRWNTTRIKEITGANNQTRITARFMRQDFFEFRPQCKIFCLANAKPKLGIVDPAMRDRLQLVPFNHYFPPEDRDPHLDLKLQAEAAGILAWMIQGCLAWQRDGLRPPAAVRDSTDAYMDEQDAFGDWLQDACVFGIKEAAPTRALYDCYAGWMLRHHEDVLRRKDWQGEMERRGYRTRHTERGTCWFGIGIASGAQQEFTSGPIPGDRR